MASCFPQFWAPKGLSYFTAIFSLVLCLVISAGNISIILAVVVDPLKKLRTPFSYFLINLAVSDFIVGAITMPVSVANHLKEVTGFNPDYRRKILHLSYFISVTSSVLSLGALSLDRFVAIKWPIKYRQSLSLKRCLAISILIWIFSAAISMIYLETGFIDFLMVFAHVSVVTTFILLVLTYQQVYKALRVQSRALRALQNNVPGQQNEELQKVRNEKKVTRAFLYIVGLFFCSYIPAIVIIYILQFCDQCSCDVRHTLRDTQFLLVSANSAMNPFVCTIRLGAFRRSIIALICRKRARANVYAAKGNSINSQGLVNQAASVSSTASNQNA